MSKFIKLNETRINSSLIKRYKPSGDTGLVLIYNGKTSKLEAETFKFESKKVRDDELTLLDSLFI